MPLGLNESLAALAILRQDNPEATKGVTDVDLAKRALAETGDERYKPAAESSGFARAFHTLDTAIPNAVAPYAQQQAETGHPITAAFMQNMAGMATPVGVSLAASKIPGPAGTAANLLSQLGYGYTSSYNEYADPKAAVGSAASQALSMWGAERGGDFAKSLLPEGAGKLARIGAGAVGGAAGGLPGLYVGMATTPGEDLSLSKLRSDPSSAAGMLLAQGVAGAGFEAAHSLKQAKADKVEQVKHDTASLDDILAPISDASEYESLQKKPLAARTELDNARMADLQGVLNQHNEFVLQDELKRAKTMSFDDFATLPESPTSIRAQIKLLSQGKKPVVEIPKGSEIPGQIPVQWQNYLEHATDDGNRYLYNPDLTNPDAIDSAKQNNTLGYLFGYGVPTKPANPLGALVLRSRKGVEKAGVLYDAATKDTITSALQKMSEGDDYIRHEDINSVLARRIRDKGQLKLFSIANEGVPEQSVNFANGVLDKLEASFVPKIRGMKTVGPRFQVDQQGNVSGKGVMQAIEQWAPKEMVDHWKDAGIDTLLGTDKVSKQALGEWLQKNTPEVEVKYLDPKQGVSQAEGEASRLQHELSTRGYSVSEDDAGAPVAVYSGEQIANPGDYDKLNISQTDRDLISRWQTASATASGLIDPKGSDAATGRYGVEPVPVHEMDNPVDILVRVPHKQLDEQVAGKGLENRAENQKSVVYQGPHFGESDKNVIASIRGYFKTLQSGEKAFFPFEIQSDWGQHVAKNIKRLAGGEAAFKSVPEYASTLHPLLQSYETLALKTAIQHARANGATKIVLPDAKTAMMTEGHDIHGFQHTIGDPGARKDLAQAAGMTHHYDESLPAIAKRLTRDPGQRVDLGKFTNREPSEYFGGKDSITGRAYDITNLSPEVKRLFSIFDLGAKADMESQVEQHLRKYTHEILNTNRESRTDYLTRVGKGEKITIEPLLDLLSGLKGTPVSVKDVAVTKKHGIRGWNENRTDTAVINRDVATNFKEKFLTYAHESTHSGLSELQQSSPEAYKALTEHILSTPNDAWKGIFDSINLGLPKDSQLNSDYLAGNKFDVNTTEGQNQKVHEVTAGLVEGLFRAEYAKIEGKKASSGWLDHLPLPVQKAIRATLDTIKRYFSGQTDVNLLDHLPADQRDHVAKVIRNIDQNLLHVERLNIEAWLKLKNTSLFDNTQFVQTLPSRDRQDQQALSNLRGGDDTWYSLAKDDAVTGPDGKKVKKPSALASAFEKHLYSALYRTQTKPETREHFFNLHFFRARIQSQELSYFSGLGQDKAGSLSRDQAIQNFAKFSDRLFDPYNKRGRVMLDTFSRIIEENQVRRDKLLNPKDGSAPATQVTKDQLVTPEEMQSKYHLTDDEAHWFTKLSELPEQVAAQKHQNNLHLDTLRIAKLFYRLNKGQNLDEVKQKVSLLTRVSGDFGAKRLEQDYVNKQLKKATLANDADQVAYFTKRQGELAAQEQSFRTLMGAEMTRLFGGTVKLDNAKITQLTEAMAGLSAIRAHQLFVTKDPGYAPMTRRGRYNVRVFGKDELGEGFGKVVHNEGFDTKGEIQEFMKKNALADNDVEVTDKEELRDRAKLYSSPDQLRRVQQRAKEELSGLLERVQSSYENADPEFKAELSSLLHDIDSSFKPLADEIKDVVSIKGDKFAERRYLVPGFDRNDFIPNIFEYMNFNTVLGEKALTRAEGELQVERGEFDKDPELRQRMTNEMNYVLAHQDEWSTLRKRTFQFYLALVPRVIVQNSFQIPLNGISQMIHDGAGMRSYAHFIKAGKLFFNYSQSGSTGDKVIDAMLKQAEQESKVVPSALDFVNPHNSEIQNALDGMTAANAGKTTWGNKVSFEATKARQSFEQTLMAFTLASESVNRKTSLIAKVLAERAAGNTDLKSTYNKAVEFTDLVNFAGDKVNRPGIIMRQGKGWENSPTGSGFHAPLLTAYALKSFVTNHISQLYSFYRQGRNGDANSKKAFMAGIVHLGLAGGAMGMVGASYLDELWQTVFGTKLSNEIRKGIVNTAAHYADNGNLVGDRIADAVLYGLPGWAGINLSQSVGLGDFGVSYSSGQPLTFEKLAGPAYGMIARIGQGAYQMASDPFNWKEGLRTASPAALTSMLHMFDVLQSGSIRTSQGAPLTDPLGGVESAGAALGLQPMSVTKARELGNAEYATKKELGDDYQRNVGTIAKLLEDYQNTGNQKSLMQANEQFSSYLSKVGGMQNRDSMVDSIAQAQQALRSPVSAVPTLTQSPQINALRSSFPSLGVHFPSGVSSLLDSLTSAQLLGQGDVVARKTQNLASSLRQKALIDSLVAAGLPPEVAHLVAQPRSVARLGGSPVESESNP